MESAIEILGKYGQADSYERTCLFLQFPDLRDAFQATEFENSFAEKDRIIFYWIKGMK